MVCLNLLIMSEKTWAVQQPQTASFSTLRARLCFPRSCTPRNESVRDVDAHDETQDAWNESGGVPPSQCLLRVRAVSVLFQETTDYTDPTSHSILEAK